MLSTLVSLTYSVSKKTNKNSIIWTLNLRNLSFTTIRGIFRTFSNMSVGAFYKIIFPPKSFIIDV